MNSDLLETHMRPIMEAVKKLAYLAPEGGAYEVTETRKAYTHTPAGDVVCSRICTASVWTKDGPFRGEGSNPENAVLRVIEKLGGGQSHPETNMTSEHAVKMAAFGDHLEQTHSPLATGVNVDVFLSSLTIWNRQYPGRICTGPMTEVFNHLCAAEAAFKSLPTVPESNESLLPVGTNGAD